MLQQTGKSLISYEMLISCEVGSKISWHLQEKVMFAPSYQADFSENLFPFWFQMADAI